jgi:hypothetical protein
LNTLAIFVAAKKLKILGDHCPKFFLFLVSTFTYMNLYLWIYKRFSKFYGVFTILVLIVCFVSPVNGLECNTFREIIYLAGFYFGSVFLVEIYDLFSCCFSSLDYIFEDLPMKVPLIHRKSDSYILIQDYIEDNEISSKIIFFYLLCFQRKSYTRIVLIIAPPPFAKKISLFSRGGQLLGIFMNFHFFLTLDISKCPQVS